MWFCGNERISLKDKRFYFVKLFFISKLIAYPLASVIGLVVGVFVLLVGFLFLILIVLTFAHIKARREIEDKNTLKDVSGKL